MRWQSDTKIGLPVAIALNWGGFMNQLPLLFFVFASLLSNIAKADVPSQVQIVNVDVRGPGCKAEETAVSISPDYKELSLLFDNHSIEMGKGSINPSLTSIKKDCQIVVDILVPPGWQFGFNSIDYRGFADIPASAWGFQRISYVPKNERISSMREVTLKGPYSDNYTQTITQKPDRIAWTKCQEGIQQIVLYSQIGLTYLRGATDRSIAMMSIDTTDTAISQDLAFEWRRCELNQPVPNPRPTPGQPIRPRRY